MAIKTLNNQQVRETNPELQPKLGVWVSIDSVITITTLSPYGESCKSAVSSALCLLPETRNIGTIVVIRKPNIVLVTI